MNRLSALFLTLTIAAAPALHAQSRGAPYAQADSAARVRLGQVSSDMMRAVFAQLHQNGAEHLNGWLEIRADSTGRVAVPRLLGSTLPDSALRGVPEIMAAALADWPAEFPVMYGFRLDAEEVLLDSVRVELSGRERAPVVLNTGYLMGAMEAIVRASGVPEAALRAGVRAEVLSRLGTDGKPLVVGVLRPTGRPELDEYLLQLGYEARYRGASVGGVRVPVWVTFPVTFGVPNPLIIR